MVPFLGHPIMGFMSSYVLLLIRLTLFTWLRCGAYQVSPLYFVRNILQDYANIFFSHHTFPHDFSIHQWCLHETVITGFCLMVNFYFSHWNAFQLMSFTITILYNIIHPIVSPRFFLVCAVYISLIGDGL